MARRARIEVVGERASVTPLELFFDLVFVFALTQVTALMAQESTVRVTAVVRGTLILTVLWWCWVGYAWLFNVIRADEGVRGRRCSGPWAACSLPRSRSPRHSTTCRVGCPARRCSRPATSSCARCTSSCSGSPRWPGTTSAPSWPARTGGSTRRHTSPNGAERHGLIIIVALGESIVSIGIGAAHLPVSWTIIVASGLGLTVTGALWWAYFDITSRITERALTAAQGTRQIMLARNGYSYLLRDRALCRAAPRDPARHSARTFSRGQLTGQLWDSFWYFASRSSRPPQR
jgi:hypothetical protein